MAQHDYDLANQSGSSFRTDLNNCLDAIQSTNSGSSAPSSTVAFQLWADSNTGILKIRNAANDDWVGLFQLDGTLTLEDGSASTPGLAFRDDLNTGIWSSGADAVDIATGGTNRLTVNSTGLTISACNIVLGDSGGATDDRIVLGAGSDLSTFHDGSNSFITNATGSLNIKNTSGSDIDLFSNGSAKIRVNAGENAVVANMNGSVELYHDNSKKLETNSSGCQVTGTLWADGIDTGDNEKLLLGDGDDLQLFHDGSQSYLAADDFRIVNKAVSETQAVYLANGAVSLYYDNAKKFQTLTNGVNIFGDLKMNTADNMKIQLGAGTDLQIYHDGSNSYLTNTTGFLNIKTTNGGAHFIDADDQTFRTEGGENLVVMVGDAEIKLYYDASLKLSTTSSGVTVQGSVTETSDIALKTNIEPLDNALEKIQQITGYKYKFKTNGHVSMGVTAQDVEKVFPELVHGGEGAKTLQYSGLIGVLIESVKELSNKVAALEATD